MNDIITLRGNNQRVQFSYVVSLTSSGYPLPIFNTVQNLKIDNNTPYTLTLNETTIQGKITDTAVLDAATKSIASNLCKISTTLQSKSDDPNYKINLIPIQSISSLKNKYSCENNSPNLAQNLTDAKIALYYDISFQNNQNNLAKDVKKYLEGNQSLLTSNKVDLYLFNNSVSKAISLDKNNLNKLDNLTYFGKSDFSKSFNLISNNYDLVIIIPSSQNISIGANISNNLTTPIYILHSNNKFPTYNNSLTNLLIENQGLVVDNLTEAINHFVLAKQLNQETNTRYFIANSFWAIGVDNKNSKNYTPANQQNKLTLTDFQTTNENDPLSYLTSKAYFIKQMANIHTDLTYQTSILDTAHNFAIKAHLVTPYSSLISLVTDLQKQNLDNQSTYYDRYEDTTTNTNSVAPRIPIGASSGGITNPFSIGSANLSLPALDQSTSREFGSSSSIGIAVPGAMSGGSSNFSVISIFIIINGGILGIAVLAFTVIKLRSYLAKKKS